MQVNTNGVVSFGEPFSAHFSLSLPLSSSSGIPLVLPFWRDVDISCTGSGEIFYRLASDVNTLQRARLLVNEYVPEFYPTSVFVATWHRVHQYQCHHSTLRNTFQAVLMTNGQKSVVAFLYKNIDWGSGAQIGFNAGDGSRSFTVPGGLTPATLYMESMSNVGRPGLFVYQVHGELANAQ